MAGTENPNKILNLPIGFPEEDSRESLKNEFENFRAKYITGKFPNGSDYLQEVFIGKDTLLKLLKLTDSAEDECAGIVVYCARKAVEFPHESGIKVNSITLAAVGVDNEGNLQTGKNDEAFFFTRPNPPYNDTWG